jgi:acetolactate synthase-1/2/3 large subunit
MVRQWQNLIYHQHYSQTTLDRAPDFVLLAQAYGLNGYRAENVHEFEQVFREALESGKGCVIDAKIDIDEMVRQMVGGGEHITNFMIN